MNRPAHMICGGISAGSAYLIIKNALHEQPGWGEFIFFCGAGSLVGILPDLLEPANSPRHRGFFHSVGFLATMGYLLYRYHQTKDINMVGVRTAIYALCAAYGSHLVLDALTPSGLPILTS